MIKNVNPGHSNDQERQPLHDQIVALDDQIVALDDQIVATNTQLLVFLTKWLIRPPSSTFQQLL